MKTHCRVEAEGLFVDLPATPLVPGLLTVGHDLQCQPEVLLGFDDRQCMTEALILDYGRVADTLSLLKTR
jgi:hypothetical protein